MAKKFLFALFLFALQLGTTPIFANAESVTVRASEDCSAPAPDSLRITSIGTNFISLAWVPAWMGATHTLVVQEGNGAGGWTTMSLFQNIPGATYLLDSLEPGTSYRCILATECPNGEVSQFKSIIDGVTLIVDLTIGGRTPLTPQQQVKCSEIPLNVHWKGFEVRYSGDNGVIKNQFEISLSGNAPNSSPTADIEIQRVGVDNPIVAANYGSEIWPDCDDNKIDAGISFKIARLLDGGGYEIAGVVGIAFHSYPSRIEVCPEANSYFPWKSGYFVSGLIAARSSEYDGCVSRRAVTSTEMENIHAQSPFQQNLRIFLNQTQTDNQNIEVILVNLNGQILFEQKFRSPIQELSVPTDNIPVGLYVVRINCDHGFKILKVLKID